MEEEYIELIPVEGHTTLGRDPASNAILNTDTSQYDAYIRARNAAKEKEKTLEDVRKELDEMKALLMDLVEKKDK